MTSGAEFDPSPTSHSPDRSTPLDVFRILGEPARADIIRILGAAGELSVSDLAERMDMSSPAVSHHLQVLEGQELLSSTRRGRYVFYRVEWGKLGRRIDRSLDAIGLTPRAGHRPGGPIRIGSTLPLSGFSSEEGQQEQQSLTLAVEEWNQQGGVHGRPVEVVVLDAGDMGRKRMVANFRALVEEHSVDAILNGYLFCTGEESEVVVESGTPYLHHNTSTLNQRQYAANPRRYWMCFQCDPPERFYAHGFWGFMRFLARSPDFRPRRREIAIVAATDNYSTIIANLTRTLAPKMGWQVSIFEKVLPPNDDWRSVLRAINRRPPDIIFLSDVMLADNVSFVRAFLESPTNSLVYGQYSPTLPRYLAELGQEAEGTITSSVGGYLPGERGEDYKARFAHRWGVSPGRGSSGVLYDQVNMYLTAVAIAGGPEDRREVCHAIESLSPRGVAGVFRFEQDRTVRSYPTETSDPSIGVPHLFMQVQKGQQRILYPPPYTEVPFRLPPWCVA